MIPVSEEEFFYKLDNMVLSCCQQLREIFKKRYKSETRLDWFDDPKTLLDFKDGPGSNVYKAAPGQMKTSLTSKLLEDWDMTMLNHVFQNFGDTTKYKRENGAVKALKDIRNHLAHHPNKKLSESNYNENVAIFKTNLQILDYSESFIDKIIDRAGVTSSLKALEYMKELVVKAEESLKANQSAKALEFFSEAITVPSLLPINLSSAFEKRAEYLLNHISFPNVDSGLVSKALSDIKQALELNESSWLANYLAAKCHRWSNNYSQAITHYQRALQISPIQQQVKQDFESCKILGLVHERHDYQNPILLMNLQERMAHHEKETGTSLTQEEFLRADHLKDSQVKGQDHVFRGDQHYCGWGVAQNFTEAAKYYAKAASVSIQNPDGMYKMAMCYQYGSGVKQDLVEALRIYRQTAEMANEFSKFDHIPVGISAAEHALARMYDLGVGVEQNLAEAANWYRKAMEHGLGIAANNLGVLYFEGRGVPQDLEKAETCWIKGCNKQDANSAASLVKLYLSKLEPEKVEFYVGRGRLMGHLGLKSLLDDELNAEKDRLIEKREESEIQNSKTDWEWNSFVESFGDGEQITMETMLGIEKMAGLGSEIAKEVLKAFRSINDLNRKLLEHNQEDEYSESEKMEIVDHLYTCITIDFSLLTVFEKVKPRLKQMLANLFEEHADKKNEQEMKIRLCYVAFNLKRSVSSDDCYDVELLKEGIRRYPENVHYFEYLSYVLGQKKKYSEGKRVAEEGLKLFPNSANLLYLYAHNNRLESVESKDNRDVIPAYNKFLSEALYEHKNVPEAFYQISRAYYDAEYSGENVIKIIRFGNELASNPNLIESYFMHGQQAELSQLPCYRLDDEVAELKTFLESVLTSSEATDKLSDENDSDKRQADNVEDMKNDSREEYLKNSKRNEIIILHRQSLAKQKSKKSLATSPKLKQPGPKSISGMTPITLQEMETDQDRIYENKMLDLVIIDDPNASHSYISLIAQDDNGDLTRVFVYNVEKSKENLKLFDVGCRLAILNPYFTAGSSAETRGIRNDEPRCLVYLRKMENVCRFCTKENAEHLCEKCKRPYCSIECKKLDTELLSHQVICPLKVKH